MIKNASIIFLSLSLCNALDACCRFVLTGGADVGRLR